MFKPISLFWFAVLLTGFAVVSPAAAAEGEGQGDLDKATETKLAATSIDDLSEAIRLAESALKKGLDATNTQFAKRLLGSALLQRGQQKAKRLSASVASADDFRQLRQAVVADLERAVEYEPKQPQAYLMLAQLSLLPEGGGIKKVASLLDKAIEYGVEDPATKARALVIRSSLHEEPKKRLADLDEAVRLMPDDVLTVGTRGLALAEMDKPELALKDLAKVLALDPNNIRAHEVKAVVLAQLKRYDEAIAAIDKARELNPQSSDPLLQRARIHSQQKKFDAALDDMNQAVAMDPGKVSLLLMRAQVRQAMGDKDKAIADIDEIVKLKPGVPAIIRMRALFLAQCDRLDEAIGDLEKLVKQDPKDTASLLQLAMLYGAKKSSLKAIDIYRNVLKQAPDDPRAIRGLADALLNVGRHAEAIATYEKAIKLDAKDDGILNNFAWVLCTSPDDKLRNGRRAIELATEACKLTEYKVPHILSTLAAAYAEVGDFDNAIKWINKGLEIAEAAKSTDKDGDKETKDALKKELENYKVKKPSRELLTEGKGDEKKGEKK
jgi:tetratricopeptide (TPR) repeat protein